MPWQNSSVTSDHDGNGHNHSGRRAPTLADVAQDARVSKTTAALVLREPSPRNISAPTQDRVRASARRLGYVRNQAGRELRSQTNTTLGFIADGIAEGPFAGEMIRGAQDAAWHRGYLLMIVEAGHDSDLVCEAVTRFTERRVRRIIYAAYAHRQVDLPPPLADANPVLANAFDAERRYPSFVPDEFGGGLLATQKLLAIRRAPVGFINIAKGDPAALGRLDGYRAAVEGAGLPFDDTLVVHTGIHSGGSADRPGKGGGNAVDGYKAARVLFRRHPRLSLLFCGTDRMAMGAYDFLKETGRRIPQDVAVVGFDNQWLVATQIRPTLTTIALPHYEMGKRAVQLALSHSDDETDPEQVALPCRLVTRKST
jgi:LacI family transcriptional regulator